MKRKAKGIERCQGIEWCEEVSVLRGLDGTGGTVYGFRDEIVALIKKIHKEGLSHDGKGFCLVLPTYPLVKKVRHDLLSAADVPGVQALNIYTFDQLVERIILEAGVRYEYIDDFTREIILGHIISRSSIPYLGRLAEYPGLVRSVAALIDEMKQFRVSPDILEKAAEGAALRRKQAILDFALIFKEYEAFLRKQGLTDREGVNLLAAEILESCEGVGFLENYELFIADYFYDLTPAQSRVFAAIKRLVPDFRFGASAIRIGPGSGAFIERKIAENAGLGMDGADIREFTPEGKLYVIKAPGAYRECMEVAARIKELIISGRRSSEIAVVLRNPGDYTDHLIRAFREEGVPCELHEKRPLATNPLIKALVKLFDSISHYRDAFDLKGLLRSNYLFPEEYSSVLDSVLPKRRITDSGEGWMKRLFAVEERLKRSMETLDRGGDEEISPEDAREEAERLSARIAEIGKLKRFLRGLFSLWEEIDRSADIDTHLESLSRLFEFLDVEQRAVYREGREGLNDRGAEIGARDWLAWLKFKGLLSRMGGIFYRLKGEDTALGLREFLELIRQGVSSVYYRLDSGSSGGVYVTTPTMIRGLSFPVVFVMGLQEGGFPKHIHDNWIIRDADRHELRRGGVMLETAQDLLSRERFLFDLILTACGERFYLSYPESNPDGSPNIPSPFISDLINLFGEGSVVEERIPMSHIWPEDYRRITCADQLLSKVSYELAAERYMRRGYLSGVGNGICGKDGADGVGAGGKADGNGINRGEAAIWPVLAQYISKNFPREWKRILSKVRIEDLREAAGEDGTAVPNRWSGFILDEDLRSKLARKYGGFFTYSISRLNDYATCPFMYFCKREIKLVPLEEATEEISPIDRGRIYHEILYRLFSARRGKAISESEKDAVLAEAERIAQDVFAEEESGGIPIHPTLWRLEKGQAFENIRAIIENEVKISKSSGGLLRPSYFEWSFGGAKIDKTDSESVEEPLVIERDGERVRLEGKIDRIDMTDDGRFIVYDYKRGKGDDPDKIAAGLSLQLPVYISAVRSLLSKRLKKDAAPIGGAYYSYFEGALKNGIFINEYLKLINLARRRKGVFDPDSFEGMLSSVEERIVDYVKGIREGNFPVDPSECPEYCEFRRVCRYGGE